MKKNITTMFVFEDHYLQSLNTVQIWPKTTTIKTLPIHINKSGNNCGQINDVTWHEHC